MSALNHCITLSSVIIYFFPLFSPIKYHNNFPLLIVCSILNAYFIPRIDYLFVIFFVDFFREGEEGGREIEKERKINLLFHLFMHSLVDSCMCPDQRSSPQPWHLGMIL